MSTDENFKFCTNCEKQIPSNKWILHENFCIQHVKKCEICSEIINKEEEEEHIQDFHSKRKCDVCHEEFEGEAYYTHKQTCLQKQKCNFCQKEFAPKAIAEHEKNCDLNSFNCAFCFADIPVKDKHEHEYFCGAKTEKCARCDKYVRLRDMDVHVSMDCHPEEIPLAQKFDLNSIQVRTRRATGKTNSGVIASLSQMGILHKGDSKSKAKVATNSNNSIKENTPNSSLSTNAQANNLINNIKTNTAIKKHQNINEASNNIKTHNLKPHNINSVNANKSNNAIPVKIERIDLMPAKQNNSNLHINNEPTSAKDKTTELKNSSLYGNNTNNNNTNNNLNNNESHKKLKEIENNLANLNNLGKNYQNINSQIEKINSINSKSQHGHNLNIINNIKKENNKHSVHANNKEKHEINSFNKPVANKAKNAGSGLNINYGVFEENKSEEPKFNVFYERHESPYNSNLNDEDYVNLNKNVKENRLLSANRYENINDVPDKLPDNNSNRVRINENPNYANLHQNNKNIAVDKDNKKKFTEAVKSIKAPTPAAASARQNSAIPNKNKKQTQKENKTTTNTNPKITPNKPTNEARIVKNLPYTKHFDINNNNINNLTPKNNNNHLNNVNKYTKNETDKKPEINSAASAFTNKASVGSSIYNINNIFSNDPSNKSCKNNQNDLIKLDQYILNSNNNNYNNKYSQMNKTKNKHEEKINTIDSSNKKPAYGSNKAKEDFKDKASNSNNTNVVIKNGNIKGTKKAADINAKNFHYEDYQDDFLHDDGYNTQDYLKKIEHKDNRNYNKQLEDEILNKVILESLKHK